MKFSYIIAIITLFICINGSVAYGQSTTNSKSEFNKNTMIQIKLRKAQECIDKGDYNGAKIYLNGILNLDKNNAKAKQLLVICNNGGKSVQTAPTTLSLSKSSLSFTALGGNDNISITTNPSSYNVELLPSWCTVQKYSNYFVITCNSNPSTSQRTDYFVVKAGNRSERVNVFQAANTTSQNPVATTLSLSKTGLSFSASGGSNNISISTNSNTYIIELLPSWCTVQKYTDYFVITCNPNPTFAARNEYFRVKAGDKSEQLYVYQAGGKVIDQPTTLSVSQESIYFDAKGGSSSAITVYSNAKTYSVSMMPSWCTIKYYSGYFVVICSPSNSYSRSDWFYVNAGDKQLKITVKQDGRATNKRRTNLYLGASALKPLVFMSDGKTLTNMNVGYGFTLGVVKTLGVYAKLNTNFSEIKSAYSYSNFPTEYYTLANTTDVYTFSRFGYVGGLMLQLKPFIFYVGAGKGHFYHYKEVNAYKYLDDSYYDKLNIVTQSFSGLETDAGLIINLNNLGLSFGVSSFSFNYYEVNAGIGIRF